MSRRFSSSSSINLIQLDSDLEVAPFVKSNSLVEMFDPIYEKQFPISFNTSTYSKENNSSSEDIFAPLNSVSKFLSLANPVNYSDDDIFEEIHKSEAHKCESIYPSLSSFQKCLSNERYSVFENQTSNNETNNSYDLRPSLFNTKTISLNATDLFNDGYANKDMERFMKNVTDLHMLSLNLISNEKSHLIFDLTSPINFVEHNYQSNTIHMIVELRNSTTKTFSSDINIFTMTERELVVKCTDLLLEDIELLFLRIWGRGEYLKQGEFPLIQNHSVFHCFRNQTSMKLVLEKIDLSDKRYQLKENAFQDASSDMYSLLEKNFYNIQRLSLENGFSTLNSYRNNIVSMLREYRSQYMDLATIQASLEVFMDKCKSLCVICHNIYTADIAQHILDLENAINVMTIAYNTKIDSNLAAGVENLIKLLDQTSRVVIKMINEVTIFCNCNFSVRPESLTLAGVFTSLSGVQTISKCRKQFSVKLYSICCIKEISSFKSFRIKLSVKVGRHRLTHFLNSKLSCFTDFIKSDHHDSMKIHPKYPNCIPFNDLFTFENLNMSCLPVETVLNIQLYGQRILQSDNQVMPEELIGWSEVALFDSAGMLLQGQILVGIWPLSKKQRFCRGTSKLKSSPILKIELPDFNVPVKYTSDNILKLGDIPFLKPTMSESKTIENMVNKIWLDTCHDSLTKSCNFLWKHRGSLMDTPRQYIALCLSLVMAWPDDIECENKDFLLNYIERCQKNLRDVTITELLHLLGPFMPLIKVRKWTVQTFRETGADGCISLIPWMVEALKYDSNLNSSGIEELLLYFSVININFSTNLFWHLSSVNPEDIHGYKSILLLGILRFLVNSEILEMWNLQLTTVTNLQKTATAVKNAKSPSERKSIMHTNLEELYDLILNKSHQEQDLEVVQHPLCKYRIPYHSGLVVQKMEMKDCSYFNSFTLPLRIVFKAMDDSSLEVMFKSGDDLRQDILVLQLFKLMDDIWITEGLDMRMVHYKVMSTGHRSGLVELVGDCTTLRKIQESKGIAAPLTSVSVISEWLKCQNTTKAAYLQSVNNFLLTCAACCVSTYLLGIGDRHNDNIMIQTTGCVFHIDFAKILGDAQTFAGIKRDRVPFVLTQDMVHVLQDYQPQGDDRRTGMQLLVDKCCEAYNAIRRHWCSLLAILTMAAEANIPGVTNKTIQYVVKMLRLHDSDNQASEQFTDLIRKSVNSISTPMNFLIHNLAQMKYFTNNEGSLFTFTPKIHRNGLRILNVKIGSVKKIRLPSKYYTYKIFVEKDTLVKPEIVFRRYEYFIELGQQLGSLFPLSVLPKLCHTIIQSGPPNGVVAAESRISILQNFVNKIMESEDEISQCDLMQTFFHSTLSDEQFIEEDSYKSPDLNAIKQTIPEIQLKFNVSNKGSKLEIFVKHARNLINPRLNEPPNAYVKTYVLPGYLDKKKTSIIMKTSCPSFNDIITYYNIHIRPDTKIEISVWHNETLGENFCIGSITLPICKNMSNEEKWYPLKSRCANDFQSRSLTHERIGNRRDLSQSFPTNNRISKEQKIV